jgi:diguanylate cyclase (GGDEF)-like protein
MGLPSHFLWINSVDLWSRGTLKSLLVPGGVLLLAAAVFIGLALPSASSSAIDFYSYAAFAAGILLSLRFRSSRVLITLISLVLSQVALNFFLRGTGHAPGPGRIALEAISILLPLNILIMSFAGERGLSVPALTPKLLLIFAESVLVAILCRPGQTSSPAVLHLGFSPHKTISWTAVPPAGTIVCLVVFCILILRALTLRKPLENGILWSLASAFLALSSGGAGPHAKAYFATAGLILVSSIIENSYVLAYHDELTSLPGRRAFNEALLRLEKPFAIAVVDIDHFKKFNDTHGHETGDEVLRMVASRLARVEGGGQAFRVGGEEFSILFPNLRMEDTVPHLEQLRSQVEASRFRVRGGLDRRRVPRGSDRRTNGNSKGTRIRQLATEERSIELSVTVSIGVAEPTSHTTEVEDVIRAADKALYRAKQAGRNRVEIASPQKARNSRLKRSTA